MQEMDKTPPRISPSVDYDTKVQELLKLKTPHEVLTNLDKYEKIWTQKVRELCNPDGVVRLSLALEGADEKTTLSILCAFHWMVTEGAVYNLVGHEDIRFIERNASKLLGTTFSDDIDNWCRDIIEDGREKRGVRKKKM